VFVCAKKSSHRPRDIVLANFSLKFAKAGIAAALSQHEKNKNGRYTVGQATYYRLNVEAAS
jgi:hypothetical protein